MLGLVILATYIEIAAIIGILARALDGFFSHAPSLFL